MVFPIMIDLKGLNLGERHRKLNSLVSTAYNVGESFEDIIKTPETSTIDRLFKIDLASKHKNVEYILKNLQDDDMLYVSKALKSKWLLEDEYRHIINPTHLEDFLYPHMITTAINKMKHWIHSNLRDYVRCQEFYEYYLEKNCEYAFKFLSKCSEEVILKEFPKKEILVKITPHRLKILCERTPSIARLYFETLSKDKLLLRNYLANDRQFFDNIKCMLKTDIDTFLNITEQHFLAHFKRLSPSSTKFIIAQRKDRFMLKPELYATRILDLNTIAQCLNQDECEELILRLARAEYLRQEWFSYKNVEPLVKRLQIEKRASLKKKVFVDKDVGNVVADWPYALPTCLNHLINDEVDVFLDKEEHLAVYKRIHKLGKRGTSCFLERALHCSGTRYQYACKRVMLPKPKSLLDALFDEYRFKSFNETLFELRKKITSESSSQNRMFMMLVLVSKTGGKEKNLDALFQLLMEHHNEPCQVRAAVIRSLVKRTYIWRQTEDIWKTFLIFGQGLGLDGNTPEADCDEGLHAVVIRSLLLNGYCEPAIKAAYIKKFSTFSNYTLTITEKQCIANPILNLLIETANAEVNTQIAAQILKHAFDTVQTYKIKIETHHDLIISTKNLVRKDSAAAEGILKVLYNSKLGRKELFRENFEMIQTDASYINALKHDITILSVDKFLKVVISENMKAEGFLRKLNVYFSGNEDLASFFLIAIKKAEVHKNLARPLTYLIGTELNSFILKLDSTDAKIKRFSALIRANAHVARPYFSLDTLEWRENGAKFIANRIFKCKAADIDIVIKRLLTWKRTARLAVVLSQRTDYEADIFETVSKIRPTMALKTALTNFRRQGDRSDLRIWEIVKPLIVKVKESIKASCHLLNNLADVESMPLDIRPEYAMEVFKVVNEIDYLRSLSVLCEIYRLLPKIDDSFVETVLYDFVQNRLIIETTFNEQNKDIVVSLYLNIFVKYLLLCKTEEVQNKRFTTVGQLYLNYLQSYLESQNMEKFYFYLKYVLNKLKNEEIFLSNEYVSCLPLFEKLAEWLHSILPVEKHFVFYVPLHLTILYYKAIRQVVKQMPDILADKQKRCNEGCNAVGEIFGKYIGHEAHVLTQKYFSSIVVLYGKGLVKYIENFNYSRFKMIPHIIKGIIESSVGIECTLARQLYDKNNYFFDNNHLQKEILEYLNKKDQIEIKFYFSDWPLGACLNMS